MKLVRVGNRVHLSPDGDTIFQVGGSILQPELLEITFISTDQNSGYRPNWRVRRGEDEYVLTIRPNVLFTKAGVDLFTTEPADMFTMEFIRKCQETK